MSTLESIVTKHSFAADISPRFTHILHECATFERFAPEQQIFRENFEADRFYLIHSGRVAIQTFVPATGVKTIQTLGADDALGWSWLYPPYRWHFTALALEPVEAAAICAKTLRERMIENHEFGYEIAMRVGKLILDRLQATRLRLLEMYGVPE
jgi:CRP/FNR family transcriptional regulator, cyclic AMP receptor protein